MELGVVWHDHLFHRAIKRINDEKMALVNEPHPSATWNWTVPCEMPFSPSQQNIQTKSNIINRKRWCQWNVSHLPWRHVLRAFSRYLKFHIFKESLGYRVREFVHCFNHKEEESWLKIASFRPDQEKKQIKNNEACTTTTTWVCLKEKADEKNISIPFEGIGPRKESNKNKSIDDDSRVLSVSPGWLIRLGRRLLAYLSFSLKRRENLMLSILFLC